PVMWDTVRRDRARPAAFAGTQEAGARVARVASAIASGHLVLAPDSAMLDDPGAGFPLVVDPPWNVGQNQWAYASADNQNAPTTDSTIASGDPSPAAAELRVGND